MIWLLIMTLVDALAVLGGVCAKQGSASEIAIAHFLVFVFKIKNHL